MSHLVDESGPAGVVLSLRKVGEQVRMEEFGEDRWRRMEMVLNMTRHEVQHRVMVAESYLELLRDNLAEKHRRRYLEKALNNVREVSRQMGLLQEYQEVGMGEPRWTELGALMDRVRTHAGKEQVEIQHDLHGLEVLADPLLESALMLFFEQEMMARMTRSSLCIFLAVVVGSEDAGVDAACRGLQLQGGVGEMELFPEHLLARRDDA